MPLAVPSFEVTSEIGSHFELHYRQNMVTQFIAMRPILDLCEGAVRRTGALVPRRWWEQTGIDWKGAREKATERSVGAGVDVLGLGA